MKKCFQTCDVFNIKDIDIRRKYFDFCYRKALRCGLIVFVNEELDRLYLAGSKYQFVRYYIMTVLKCERKLKGIKRVISFIFK